MALSFWKYFFFMVHSKYFPLKRVARTCSNAVHSVMEVDASAETRYLEPQVTDKQTNNIQPSMVTLSLCS